MTHTGTGRVASKIFLTSETRANNIGVMQHKTALRPNRNSANIVIGVVFLIAVVVILLVAFQP